MPWTKTSTETEPVRVNKWLAQAGICSRREAESFISQGLVSIDGTPVQDLGRKIAPGETLTLADAGTRALATALTAVLNKPVGYVSAQPEQGQTPAARLVTAANRIGAGPTPERGARLAPAGRLDQDSRGLLLLTEDGVLTKAVIGPSSAVDKEYIVTVTGRITREGLARLRHGLVLDGRKLRPAEVSQEGDQTLRMVLCEGRKRQIRRMCELVHLHVTDLVRVRIGPVTLDSLAEGKWRVLSPGEREALITQSTAGAAPQKAHSPPQQRPKTRRKPKPNGASGRRR